MLTLDTYNRVFKGYKNYTYVKDFYVLLAVIHTDFHENKININKNNSKYSNVYFTGKPHLLPPPKLFSFIASAKSKKTEMNYHTISVPGNDTGLHVIIRPQSEHDVYDLYIKYAGFPNESYYDWRTEVCVCWFSYK